MKTTPTEHEGVPLIEPQLFEDPRGFFMETYHRDCYQSAGIAEEFCQDNLSLFL